MTTTQQTATCRKHDWEDTRWSGFYQHDHLQVHQCRTCGALMFWFPERDNWFPIYLSNREQGRRRPVVLTEKKYDVPVKMTGLGAAYLRAVCEMLEPLEGERVVEARRAVIVPAWAAPTLGMGE